MEWREFGFMKREKKLNAEGGKGRRRSKPQGSAVEN